MKVLMLGWELPPNNSGGLGVASLQLSKALAQAGADIDFILPFYHAYRYDFMKVTSVFHPSIKFNESIGVYDSLFFRNRSGDLVMANAGNQQSAFAQMVGQIVESKTFDVIHAHDWLTFRAGLLARQISHMPLLLHVHSIERDRAGGQAGNPWVREIEATAMLIADHIFAVSQRTRRMIIEDYGIPADKIEVVHNSFDKASLQPLDDENAYAYLSSMKLAGWKVVASIGRITIQKGLSNLLMSAAEVIKWRPKTLFLFIGDGEQRNELLELSAQLGIAKNVIFTGFQRGKNVRDAYAVADLFVLPSVSEPFGLTPYEAAAYGTPSLISKQSGVAENLTNCLKVDFWDIQEMANKITGVVSEENLQSELGINAHSEFERLSWQKAAKQIIHRYNNVGQEALV